MRRGTTRNRLDSELDHRVLAQGSGPGNNESRLLRRTRVLENTQRLGCEPLSTRTLANRLVRLKVEREKERRGA